MQPYSEFQCKWIMAILSGENILPETLYQALEKTFGPVQYKGPAFPFETTDYYENEFGTHLNRRFIAFEGLDTPEKLVSLKLSAMRLEAEWQRDGKRWFNLDIGYMDADKVVLASFKRGPCKLYLGDGVYADLLLKYSQGHFDAMPWAFSDFKDGRYQKSLLVIREKLKSEMRKMRISG